MDPRSRLRAVLAAALLALPALARAVDGTLPCHRPPAHPGELRMPDRFDGRSPVRTWRTVDLRPISLRAHRCYARLDGSRSECDGELLRDLETACRATYSGPVEAGALERCLLFARTCSGQLTPGAPESWRDAQYEALHLHTEADRVGVRTSDKWEVEYPRIVGVVPPGWR